MDRMRLGLVCDRSFLTEQRYVCALTPELIHAFERQFEICWIGNQKQFNQARGQVDFIISMEPEWAAPLLHWRWKSRWQILGDRPNIPCFVLMSDPHKQHWRQRYFMKNRLDAVLALYDQPSRKHFKAIPDDKIISFPWSVPESWISHDDLTCRDQEKLMIFGAATGPAYELRNWCREQEFVASFNNSGVEDQVVSWSEYIGWLGSFDAIIAAGSEDPTYRLTTPKYFEIAASGALLFAQETDDLTMLGFRDGENCVIFRQDSFLSKAQHYLDTRSDQRWLEIRENGRRLIRNRHTNSCRIETLRRLVRSHRSQYGE
ncbi:MAG: glycosyltransferase family 1 protein [Planctomycetaceae bacterium]|nr:glycosyltransferase family 1 protein [Planctomycetaceae bacterium]